MKKPYQQELTIREQAAVLLFAHGIITRKPDLLRIAYGGSLEQAEKLKDLPASATRWFSTAKIQAMLSEITAQLETQRKRDREALESEIMAKVKQSTQKDGLPAGMVDYSLPENQLRKLNELIHTAPDQRDELDALKLMIAQTPGAVQHSAREKQVRAYLPITCYSCPLYQKAKEKTRISQKHNEL